MNRFLIAGLGNIGSQYDGTRHNIGFDVLDELAARHNGLFQLDRHAQHAEISVKGRKLHLIKPTTYMNLSGKAVQYWLTQCKIGLPQLLVITDDLALPPGKLRLKLKGSDGGHNGLKSINEVCGSTEYPRLRFGIGSDFRKGAQVEYVLGRWKDDELESIRASVKLAADAVEAFVLEGAGPAMTRFNAL